MFSTYWTLKTAFSFFLNQYIWTHWYENCTQTRWLLGKIVSLYPQCILRCRQPAGWEICWIVLIAENQNRTLLFKFHCQFLADGPCSFTQFNLFNSPKQKKNSDTTIPKCWWFCVAIAIQLQHPQYHQHKTKSVDVVKFLAVATLIPLKTPSKFIWVPEVVPSISWTQF